MEWTSPDASVLVINLARRPDRLASISEQLRARRLPFHRIDAIDARDLPSDTDTRLVPIGHVACARSHATALHHIAEGTPDFCLVLEDDALLHPDLDWPALIDFLPTVMEAHSIGLLQLGYISMFDPLQSLPRFIARRLAERHHEVIETESSGKGLRIVQDDFRAGSHAYLVRRTSARALFGFNEPVARAVDDFFTDLSHSGAVGRGWHIARLSSSAAEQQSRVGKANTSDSDVNHPWRNPR
jgi:glycosyl transferase family 25